MARRRQVSTPEVGLPSRRGAAAAAEWAATPLRRASVRVRFGSSLDTLLRHLVVVLCWVPLSLVYSIRPERFIMNVQLRARDGVHSASRACTLHPKARKFLDPTQITA